MVKMKESIFLFVLYVNGSPLNYKCKKYISKMRSWLSLNKSFTIYYKLSALWPSSGTTNIKHTYENRISMI